MKRKIKGIEGDSEPSIKKDKKPNIMDDSPTTPSQPTQQTAAVQATPVTTTTVAPEPTTNSGDLFSANQTASTPIGNTNQTAQQPISITPSEPLATGSGLGQASPEEEKAIQEIAKALGAKTDSDSKESFNPFSGNVKPRGEHAKVTVDASIKDEIQEFIPPTNILPPPVQDSASKTPPPPINPEMQNLPPEQSRESAEVMVDVVLDIYGIIKKFIGSKVKIDVASKKIQDLVKTSGLSIDMPLPMPDGSQTTFREIATSFDSQVEESFVVTDSFKAKIREPLIQEFMKHGIGLTNMQRIATFAAIDVAQTIVLVIQLNSTKTQIIQNQLDIQRMIMEQQYQPNRNNTSKKDEVIEPEILEPEEK